jgi:hypothetical protein
MGAFDQRKSDKENAITTYPYGLKPHATYKFRFRSRSKNTVKDCSETQKLTVPRRPAAEGIIQRLPTPVALVCRDPEDLTQEEACEVIRRLRAQIIKNESEVKPGKCSYKRQRSDVVDGDDEEVTITRVETQDMKRARVIRASSGAQVFDLTDEGAHVQRL